MSAWLAVQAAGTPEEKIKVCEMPIYEFPDNTKYIFQAEKISTVRQYVSQFRQVVWKYRDSIQGTVDDVTEKYRRAKTKTLDTVEYIQSDPGILPRAGVITVAGLGGIVAGYKGGALRKIFYCGSSMLVAASLCYPNQAVDITRTGFFKMKDFAYEQYKGEKPPPRLDMSEPDVAKLPSGYYDNISSKVQNAVKKYMPGKNSDRIGIPNEQKLKDIATKGESNALEDHGQSNPADKDLYTTRGK